MAAFPSEVAMAMYSRRYLLNRALVSSAALAIATMPAWAFAEALLRTPRQTEGPFYPDHLPLDTDNDLLIINDSINQSIGTVAHVTGKILDANGDPVRNALVEIWQADGNGVYIHSQSGNAEHRDKNFQGYGKFLTGSKGEYYFRTIKPVPYPGRTPHIHFAIGAKGMEEKFTTQCYIKGEKRNGEDFVLNAIRDEKQRAAVQVPFTPIEKSKIGEVEAHFDVVLGWTPKA
jgi:protocatechuate 3,4-dioxygenase beta subunit